MREAPLAFPLFLHCVRPKYTQAPAVQAKEDTILKYKNNNYFEEILKILCLIILDHQHGMPTKGFFLYFFPLNNNLQVG